MKFRDYKYERPDFNKIEKEFNSILTDIQNSQSLDEQINNITRINALRIEYTSMKKLAGLRFSMDTTDKFYRDENDYFDDKWPFYEGLNVKLYEGLLNSKFLPQLKEKYGKQFFDVASNMLKSFDTSIMEEMQEDNKLISDISKLKASAKVYYDGEYRNLAQLSRYMESDDRNVRKSASDAYFGFFNESQNIIDDIFDNMVIVRDRKARKLGYKNYIELGYDEMNRTDYDANMVAHFRDLVLKHIVPVTTELIERQKKRININDMQYYDEKLKFLSGNALPMGTQKEIMANGLKMYDNLSPETSEYFRFMVDHDLIDVTDRPGKENGGFCTYIAKYKSPFIFANFNGTSSDVNVLTHEAGHAFQKYMSLWIEMPESIFATLESAEIHSMAMEFFTWPYMSKFFGTDTEKYKFAHVEHALEFIPYGVAVDEFQHKIYENPQASPMERRTMWRETEKKYLPHRKYDDNSFLDSGTWWYRQGHIFFRPFYYIDYTLAQICALQFWKKMSVSRSHAWDSYLKLCSLGGTKSFLDLLKGSGLSSPFEKDCVVEVTNYAKSYLDSIDDSKL